ALLMDSLTLLYDFWKTKVQQRFLSAKNIKLKTQVFAGAPINLFDCQTSRGLAPGACLPLRSYKSKLLTPQSEGRHHLLSEGYHPLQGDKQNDKPFRLPDK
ncbi:MAG: hypothetical protein ACI3Y5_05140, partial [Prevotella sp.]